MKFENIKVGGVYWRVGIRRPKVPGDIQTVTVKKVVVSDLSPAILGVYATVEGEATQWHFEGSFYKWREFKPKTKRLPNGLLRLLTYQEKYECTEEQS